MKKPSPPKVVKVKRKRFIAKKICPDCDGYMGDNKRCHNVPHVSSLTYQPIRTKTSKK